MSKIASWIVLGVVALAAQGCSSCDGCSCGGKAAAPAAARAEPAATPAPAPRRLGNKPAPPPHLRPQPRRTVPITTAEIEPVIPALPGAILLGPAQVLPSSNQLRYSYCLDQPDAAKGAAEIAAALEDAGWTGVRVRPNPKGIQRVGVGGKKDAFRLNGQISTGNAPGCDSAAGKTIARLTVFKVGDPGDGATDEDDGDKTFDPRSPAAPRHAPGEARAPDP